MVPTAYKLAVEMVWSGTPSGSARWMVHWWILCRWQQPSSMQLRSTWSSLALCTFQSASVQVFSIDPFGRPIRWCRIDSVVHLWVVRIVAYSVQFRFPNTRLLRLRAITEYTKDIRWKLYVRLTSVLLFCTHEIPVSWWVGIQIRRITILPLR